jgi:hypothetical protein
MKKVLFAVKHIKVFLLLKVATSGAFMTMAVALEV